MSRKSTIEVRALAILRSRRITEPHPNLFIVPASGGASSHIVTVEDDGTLACRCPAWAAFSLDCPHTRAVELFIAAGKQQPAVLDVGLRIAKKTYSQDWPVYQAARRAVDEMIPLLLRAACRATIKTVDHPGRGRKPLSFSDAILAVGATRCLMHKGGLISDSHVRRLNSDGCFDFRTAPSPSALSKAMRDEKFVEHANKVLCTTALPLVPYESHFCVDRSVYKVPNSLPYVQLRKNGEVVVYKPEEVHLELAIGRRSLIHTAAIINAFGTHEGQWLKPLLMRTKGLGFTIPDVSADKGYSSGPNREFVEDDLKARFWCPFKSNSVDHGTASTWDRQLREYLLQGDAWFCSYHNRSIIESYFSVDSRANTKKIRSRTPVAQQSELLARSIIHNLRVLVLWYFARDIKIDFLENDREAKYRIESLKQLLLPAQDCA